MSDVYANGMEVSAKKDANKSLAAMPDVCLSPPTPPAGPIPIPYPNFADASDTSDGSKTVKIGGEEVGLKNSSNYKQSKGDEAATRGLGMGVVTHTIQGKLKHTAWSFDVKVEDKNVIRHMDMTTHNHMNCPNIALTLNQAGMNMATARPLTCAELEAANASMRAQGAGGNALRPSAGDQSITVTTASYSNPPGAPAGFSFMAAVSRQDLVRSANRPAEGRNGAVARSRPADQTMGCTDEQWGSSGLNNHTEPKLMEQVFDAAGRPNATAPAGSLGTMTMNIYHCNINEGTVDADPCPRCECGICTAQACGLRILICDLGEPICVNGRFAGYNPPPPPV
jgi:hypothetical protein